MRIGQPKTKTMCQKDHSKMCKGKKKTKTKRRNEVTRKKNPQKKRNQENTNCKTSKRYNKG